MSKRLHTVDDKALVRQITSGKRGAFDELYRRYHKRMHAYFYKMLYNDPELAHDSTQECFMKVIEKLDSYNDEYAFSTWIYAIAYNMCKNHYRKAGNKKVVIDDLTAHAKEQVHQPEATQVADEMDQEVYNTYLRSALSGLKPEQQQLITLRFEEELELKDIGQIMGIPEGTVKSRLHYTLKKLATTLAPMQQLRS